MIETVQATADTGLVGDPADLLDMLAADHPGGSLWRRIGPQAMRLDGSASGLGSLVLRRGRYGNQADHLQLVAEGNLTSLLYGPERKTLTTAAGDVTRGLVLLVAEAVRVLPTVAPRSLTTWRCSRVDASVTWALQPTDAALLFPAMRDSFFSLDGGRIKASQPGPRSLMLRRTSEDTVRLYDKTAETLAHNGALPPRYPSDRATLVRLESQIVARTARRRYGETLADLADLGAQVATTVLTNWLETFGGPATGKGAEEVFARLTMGGMAPDRAMLLTGPALLLRSGGVDALVSKGLSRRTAYAWRSEIRDAVPDEAWREVLGIPLDPADAAFADAWS